MCGIAGYYNTQPQPSIVAMVLDRLKHRGPDAQNTYQHHLAGLIHTRLSILELSDLGIQPYRFEYLALVFNGEIYNYREVRETLKAKGYSFHSNADSEVLIKAFHCWREKAVDYFIGMFAFAVFDELEDALYLFRDRVGVKPLYYTTVKGAFYFASELHALKAFEISNEISSEALTGYFRFGFVPRRLAIYEGVYKLEPGHYIRVSQKGLEDTRYWYPLVSVFPERREAQWLDELEHCLISAFRYRMVSDVPVGVFLSGGIDSSLLAAILQKHHGGIHTFTIGFQEAGFDESGYARQVAGQLGTQHTERILQLRDARSTFLDFYSIYDEPFADTSGIPTSCVTQLAKENGMKVVLSADGGDELFGGYTHYQYAMNLYRRFSIMPESIRALLARSSAFFLPQAVRSKIWKDNFEHKLYALEELLTAPTPALFFEAFLANQSLAELSLMMRTIAPPHLDLVVNQANPIETMMDWDFQHYLPDDLLVKVDRATMHHGVECREPMLDHQLIELIRSMPLSMKIRDGQSKYALRKIAAKYLPSELFNRKKMGFSIPLFEWFSQDLDSLFEQYLTPERLSAISIFHSEVIQHEYQKYRRYKSQGRDYNIEKMWRILSFMLWVEKHYQK